ncbi:hypothetical protein [Altericroceibacterium spongiae]|uniref:hypothetical protein n=1 Tax=Altericroceibacterium spongiae TaxID=2320269 RepID=UPI001AECCD46|nr:hypothetical protein [Altericroceibacterium spongiae]
MHSISKRGIADLFLCRELGEPAVGVDALRCLDNVPTVAQCDATVGANASTSLALLLHELATNAVKYGALSNPDSQLMVDIAVANATITE